MKSFRVVLGDRRIDITFGDRRFTGPIVKSNGALSLFQHDLAPFVETPPRELAIFRQGNGVDFFAHGNGIPILSWTTSPPSDLRVFSTRMLRQRDFNAIHPRYAGNRGVFSPFTGICDIAIDNVFFRDPNGDMVVHNLQSTLAHELSHRKFSELDDWLRAQMINAFRRDEKVWHQIRAEFQQIWGAGIMLSSPAASSIEDAIMIVDELLAKACSYEYRASTASWLIQFIQRKVFSALPAFNTFIDEVMAETGETFHSDVLLPVFDAGSLPQGQE